MNLWTSSLRRLLTDFGVGGTSWTGTRTSGDGRTGAKTPSALNAVTLYVVQQLPHTGLTQILASLAGENVPTPEWWGLTAAGVDMQIGDVRTSGADSSYTFRVLSVTTVAGMCLCELERE